MAKTICLQLPESLTRLWKSEKELTKDMKESLALELVRKHKITFRQGAELLGKSYKDFLDFMFQNEVPVFDYEPGWLEKELETSRKLGE